MNVGNERHWIVAVAVAGLMLSASALLAAGDGSHAHHDHAGHTDHSAAGAPADGDAAAPSFQSQYDFFTNFGQYMPRIHCMMDEAGRPDWPWIIMLIGLSAGVVLAYLKILRMWRQCYLAERPEDRNEQLMQLAHIFTWCAVCGYTFSIVMFFWPAYRLLAIALAVLNVWSWAFALNSREFQKSFRAKRFERELAESLRDRNFELETRVHERTSELTRANEQLRMLSETDPLTGLLNRSAILRRIDLAVERTQDDDAPGFALLFVDFDRFKSINDTMGHHFGDELLKQIAERLKRKMRHRPETHDATTGVARFGGDEFVILVGGITCVEDATAVADRLLRTLARPYNLFGQEVESTASIGVTTFTDDEHTTDEIVRNADMAMYEAKRRGKAQYVIFNRRMREEARHRTNLERELRLAWVRGEMRIVHQPIIDLSDGRVVGVETFLRWDHPEYRKVPTERVVQHLEESGLTRELTEWSLREALGGLAEARARHVELRDTFVSVNLTALQLLLSDLPAMVRDLLERHALPGEALHLEVNEKALGAMWDDVRPAVETMRELGVAIDVDHFGSGYSSLGLLQQLRPALVKIDFTLIDDLRTHREALAASEAVCAFAHSMGIRVVAHNIESAEQIAQLQAISADLAQGRSYCEEMDLSTLAAWGDVFRQSVRKGA